MKKVLVLFIISLFVLVGCSDTAGSAATSTIFNELKKQKIISKKYKKIATEKDCNRVFGACSCDYNYVYKKSSSDIIEITYYKSGSSGHDYKVIICDKMEENDFYAGPHVDEIEHDECYYSDVMKYIATDDTVCKTYYADRTGKIFGKKYKFTEK